MFSPAIYNGRRDGVLTGPKTQGDVMAVLWELIQSKVHVEPIKRNLDMTRGHVLGVRCHLEEFPAKSNRCEFGQ